MNNEPKADKSKEVSRKPLFTGNGVRDASVSEWEKMADATCVIREAIMKLIGKAREK